MVNEGGRQSSVGRKHVSWARTDCTATDSAPTRSASHAAITH